MNCQKKKSNYNYKKKNMINYSNKWRCFKSKLLIFRWVNYNNKMLLSLYKKRISYWKIKYSISNRLLYFKIRNLRGLLQ